MYLPAERSDSLTQGHILDSCPILGFEVSSPDSQPVSTEERARVMVLSQACDLAQGKTERVLVAVVLSAKEMVERGILKTGFIRDNVRRGLVFGWYFLPASEPPISFQESVIDLRDLHTLDRGYLQRMLEDGKGVCRLGTPYREHLNQHFAVTYMRIGLPEPYSTEA